MKKTIFLLFSFLLFKFVSGQSELVWARSFSGNLGSECPAIYADASGNVFTAGQFEGTVDFDPGPGTFTLTSFGSWDAYMVKVDANGNFLWARQFGGTNEDCALNFTFDATGTIYLTGHFTGTCDFDPGAGLYNLTGNTGWSSAFIVKLDMNGNFVWAVKIGGTMDCDALSIAVDQSNNSYITGSFDGTVDFDPGAGTFTLTDDGNSNIYVAKVDNAGAFVWAKKMNGTSGARGMSLVFDGVNSIYTTGWFKGTVDFDPNAGTSTLTSSGYWDVFINKLDLGGNFIWTKQVGGSAGDDIGKAITTDPSGAIYLTGTIRGTADLDPGPGVATFSSTSGDMFVLKLDISGNYVFAKSVSSSLFSAGNSIALDASNNIYTTGYFGGTTDFDPGPGSSVYSTAGSFDIFISKLDPAGSFLWARRIGGTGNDDGQDIFVDASNNIYTSGFFSSTVDFDTGPNSYTMTAPVFETSFLMKQGATVGMEEYAKNNYVSFFPNPVSDQLKLHFDLKSDFDAAEIKIYDFQGKMIEELKLNKTSDTIELPIKYNSGVYFYSLFIEGKEVKTEKILIQK
jgi:hypothetical protein